MSVDTIILDTMNALQTLNASVTGVQAPQVAAYPTNIDTTNGQPFVMTWPGDGEAWQKGDGYCQGIMTYRIIVFLDPVAQQDIPAHVADGALLMQKLWNLYVNRNNTPIANNPPYQTTIMSGPDGSHIGKSGLGPNLTFGGRPWVGFELTVPVRAQWQLP